MLMDASGANQMVLTSGFDPKWSPDGKKIVFIRYVMPTPRKQIAVINADGTNETLILDLPTIDDGQPAWSPDGAKIAFVSFRDIYTIDTTGGNLTNLTNSSLYDMYPAWSPDGTKIAFSSGGFGSPKIYVMDANGNNQKQLTKFYYEDVHPAWSPDGTRLVFQRDGFNGYNNYSDIIMMKADGTQEDNLTKPPDLYYWMVTDDRDPDWNSAAAVAPTPSPTPVVTPTPTPSPTPTPTPINLLLIQLLLRRPK